MPPLPGLVGNRKAFGQIGQKQIGQIHFCIVFSALSLNYIPKIKTRKSTKNLVVSKFYCTFAAKVSNMGKLAFLLCFILSEEVVKDPIVETRSLKNDSLMCKYKDIDLGIKKLDFNVKRGAMAVFLTDGREVIVPVSMFPDIKKLSKAQREDYMIMDDQYFSFESLSRIYSIKDVLRC